MPFVPGPDLRAGPFGRRGASMGPQIMSLHTEGKPPPPKPPGGVRVEDRIGVQAPAEVIWNIVHDLPSWSAWNPTYTAAEGRIRIGETLTLTLALPGEAPQEIRPKVLEWVPNEQLHWRLTMMGGLIRTLRYIEIQNLGPANCVIDNGELFGGLMGPSLGRRVGRTVQRGFRAMNEALKARAEAAWAAQRE
jgi:hypothetical protein